MSVPKTIEDLQSVLRGELIQAGDKGYDEARKVYNAMIDRRPRAIARCVDVADVIACVHYGRENGLLTAVRCGGHNGGGLGICDDGLVIDLSRMNGVRVDPEARTVRAEGGCRWGDVDHATHAFGLATPTGIISTTGVGGLTLGGGLGHLTRSCGLTIDNLLAADVVLADGSFVQANAEKNEDLFWALRGGGGNFGVVTSFLFRCHPIEMVIAGPMMWELEQATEVMKWYRDFIARAPEDLNGFFAFLSVPPAPPFPENLHLKKVCAVVWTYTGPQDKADEVLAAARKVATPVLDMVGPMPVPALNSMFDPIYPPGDQWYWRADFVNELSDEAIALHAEYASKMPTWKSTMHMYPISGAAHKPANDDTPWAYRKANWAQVIVGVDPDPANKDAVTNWTKDYFDALHPYSAGGAYVNFMMDEGHERVQATYRGNFDRLVAIKNKYDPSNFFRVNQNIRPAS